MAVPKSFTPAAGRHYLSASVHLGSILDYGTVHLQPKFATVAKVTTDCRASFKLEFFS